MNAPLARVHTLAHSFVLDEEIGEMEFDTDSPSRKQSFAEASGPRVSQSSSAFSTGTSLPGSNLAKQHGGYTPSSRTSSTDKLPIPNSSTPTSKAENRLSVSLQTSPPADISASSKAVSPVLTHKSKDEEIADYRAQAALETQRQLKELQIERERQRAENEVGQYHHYFRRP